MRLCSVKNCTKKHCAKGFCPMHYRRKTIYTHIRMDKPQLKIYGRGYIIDKDGYKQVRNETGKYVREHRLTMEKKLGRDLNRSEIVHHINGVRTDNRIENLELTNFSEHTSNHLKNYYNFMKQVKEKALSLYKIGVSMTEIAKHLPISCSAIYWFIKASGYPIRGKHVYTKVKCPAEMSASFYVRKSNFQNSII